MTKKEFLKRIDKILSYDCIGFTCSRISEKFGYKARDIYNRDFRFSYNPSWVSVFAVPYCGTSCELAEDKQNLRIILIGMFRDFFLEYELYKEFEV